MSEIKRLQKLNLWSFFIGLTGMLNGMSAVAFYQTEKWVGFAFALTGCLGGTVAWVAYQVEMNARIKALKARGNDLAKPPSSPS